MQIKEEIWNYTNLRAKIILCPYLSHLQSPVYGLK